MSAYVLTRKGQTLETPSFINLLFSDKRFSILWLAIRVWLGWQWIDASLHKLSNPAWMKTGEALKGFWMGAVQIPAEGRPPISFAWYRTFLQAALDAQAYTWFAKVVAVSELLIGIALIAGIFVGLTAFFGGFMNWNFIMAGSASVMKHEDKSFLTLITCDTYDEKTGTYLHRVVIGAALVDVRPIR